MEYLATLVFDSLISKAQVGLRGYTFASRQLLFSARAFDVDIELTPIGGQLSLVGQLLANDGQPILGEAQLALDQVVVAGIPLTRHGEFHFTLAEPGAYTIRLQVGERTILLPALDIAL